MKESRHDVMLKIIEEEPICRQEELLNRLKQLGYNITQSTISRDIKKLNIVKAPDKNGLVRYMEISDKIIEKGTFMDTVIGADYAGHMAVIKCKTGMAQAVCATLDTMNYPETVGTIAGDDTIFMVMRSENDAKHLVKIFKSKLGLKD